jgi:Protein of unknown function (DUF2795)
MERGSDKHSARLDEEMGHEVQGLLKAGRTTHAEEWKSPEPSGEDQPDVDRSPDGTMVGGVPDGLTEADIEGRSELATYLGKEVWPATGQQLHDVAHGRSAPDAVLARLAALPPGRTFTNLQQVWTQLAGGAEAHRF